MRGRGDDETPPPINRDRVQTVITGMLAAEQCCALDELTDGRVHVIEAAGVGKELPTYNVPPSWLPLGRAGQQSQANGVPGLAPSALRTDTGK